MRVAGCNKFLVLEPNVVLDASGNRFYPSYAWHGEVVRQSRTRRRSHCEQRGPSQNAKVVATIFQDGLSIFQDGLSMFLLLHKHESAAHNPSGRRPNPKAVASATPVVMAKARARITAVVMAISLFCNVQIVRTGQGLP